MGRSKSWKKHAWFSASFAQNSRSFKNEAFSRNGISILGIDRVMSQSITYAGNLHFKSFFAVGDIPLLC